MPRFFFHVYDDMVVHDDEGIQLPDVEAARAAALSGARALICEEVMKGRLCLDHRVEVEDEAGERVLVLPFREVIAIDR